MTSNDNSFRSKLVRIEWLLITQFGFDPRKFLRSIYSLPHYFISLSKFRYKYTGPIDLVPCLQDFHAEGGATKNEYFWLDLLVAKRIFNADPIKHIDIGSRVDGFVAHVASFREIEVFDIRPLTAQIPGVSFRQADFMSHDKASTPANYCDSISCLHALEHFGLGRYGDPLDPLGHEIGLKNMSGLLKPNGIFYLAVPLGVERVEFNANRVFSPHTIINLASKSGLQFEHLITIDSNGFSPIIDDGEQLSSIADQRYILGLFEFKKLS